MPAAQALTTWSALKARADAKKEAKRKASEKKRLAHDAFNSPEPDRRVRARTNETEKLLISISEGRRNPKRFMALFTGLRRAAQHKVTKMTESL